MRLFLATLLLATPALAYDVVWLDVADGATEATWTAALADQLGEADDVVRSVPYGVADVVTDELVIEVDRLPRMHNAIGQAIHYRAATGKQAVIAVIRDGKLDYERLRYFDELCRKEGIEIWLLRQK